MKQTGLVIKLKEVVMARPQWGNTSKKKPKIMDRLLQFLPKKKEKREAILILVIGNK